MYLELELQYNNHGLTELENQLKAERNILRAKYDDTKVNFKLRQVQDKIIKKEEQRTAKF